MVQQIKHKTRIRDHGEVFTAEREVNAMLDLVRHETERIESRFLEPACGTGNFLIEVLRRKLEVVIRRYGRRQADYERAALMAVSSLYGIDLLEDNVIEARERLYALLEEQYRNRYKKRIQERYLEVIRFVLEKNIVVGDALTFRDPRSNQPIVLPEWSAVNGVKIKRRDFIFEYLLPQEGLLASDMEVSDIGEPVFIPKPVKEYPLTHYLRLADVE